MTTQPDEWGVPDSFIFDGKRSQAGYALNEMCISLTEPANRARFKADEAAYMANYALTEAQKQAVLARDWHRLIELGGNIYFLMKIGACIGQGLYTIGAQQRGETLDQFLATRAVKGAT
jgi:protocatechuate 4,5-dioxygenase alpha chain